MTAIEEKPLPAGWKWVKLGDVCRTTSGGTPSRGNSQFYNGNIAWIKSGELNDGIIETAQETITEEAVEASSTKVFPSGTLLIALYGATVGKLGILGIDAATNQAVCAIFPSEKIDRDYLFLYLLQERERLLNLSFGGAQPNISQDIVRSILIPLPPLPEQKRIAAVLTEQIAAVDRARVAAEAQLQAAKQLPAAFLSTVFDSPEAQQWPTQSLKEICSDISDGTHFTPTYIPAGIPFLSVKDVKENGISFQSCRYISEDEHFHLCKRCKPEKGDVLYTKVGTTGVAKAIDVDEEFSIFVSVALLKLKPGILPGYIERVLNAPIGRIQAEKLTQGMANRNLVLQDLKRIEVPVPPTNKQEEVADVLENHQRATAKVTQSAKDQLDTINQLPATLLRQAFAGDV